MLGKKKCSCIEITNWGKVLGWIGIFIAIIGLSFCGVFLFAYGSLVEHLGKFENSIKMVKIYGSEEWEIAGDGDNEMLQKSNFGIFFYHL
jgi:hypothetical protein